MPTEPTHTPGPWHFTKRDCAETGSVHYSIETVDKLPEHPHSQRFICWMTGSLGETLHNRHPLYTRDDPQTEADARLMAASPDLLAALKHFAQAAESWHEFHRHDPGIHCDQLCDAIAPAREAIHKAEVAL